MKISSTQYGGGQGSGVLRADDVKNGTMYQIEKFEEISTKLGVRPALRLKGTDKAFFLNQTNLRTMIEKFGDETNKWLGKKFRFSKIQVNNPTTGRMQPGLRIE